LQYIFAGYSAPKLYKRYGSGPKNSRGLSPLYYPVKDTITVTRKTITSMIVMKKINEKIVNLGQNVNFNMSKKLSRLGSTNC